MCRRLVYLHGPFKKFHDGPVEVEAATPWEAIEAVVNQIKGFLPNALTGRKRIQCAGYTTMESLKTPDDNGELHILPAMFFGKQGGIIQTIIGLTLIAIVVWAAWFTGGTSLTLLGQTMLSAGIGLTMGGIMQMLTPMPKAQSAEARSKYLASTQNTIAVGTPIALLYGRFRCGGQIMSMAVDSKSTPTR